MIPCRWIAPLACVLVFLPAAAGLAHADATQDPPKQEEHPPVPKEGFGRKTDKDEPRTGTGVAPGIRRMYQPAGFYLGGHYVRGTSAVRTTETFAEGGHLVSQFDADEDANGLGGLAGYDFARPHFTIGPYASFDWLPQGTHPPTVPVFTRAVPRWSVDVGARVGVVALGVYVYGLFGVGWLNQGIEIQTLQGATLTDAVTPGVIAGVGAEIRVAESIRVYLQYEHGSWQDATVTMPAAAPFLNYAFQQRTRALRFGVVLPMGR